MKPKEEVGKNDIPEWNLPFRVYWKRICFYFLLVFRYQLWSQKYLRMLGLRWIHLHLNLVNGELERQLRFRAGQGTTTTRFLSLYLRRSREFRCLSALNAILYIQWSLVRTNDANGTAGCWKPALSICGQLRSPRPLPQPFVSKRSCFLYDCAASYSRYLTPTTDSNHLLL